jgi:anti-repressor protein
MCEYGLIEHQDFVALHHKRLTAQGNETTQFDHQLTLSMAKEISMIQRNEKGKQARQYFIECERKLKQLDKPSYQIEDPIERAKKWIIEQEEQARLQKENKIKQLLIEEMQPKAEFADKLLKSKDNLLIREYSKVLQDEGFTLGEKKLYKWFRDNGYLMQNNEPYQAYMRYFVVKESTVDTPWGEKITKTTKINPEGQLYFYKKLNQEFNFSNK